MARILIIDDDDQSLYFMRKILEEEGHEVAEAGDGEAGMKAQREKPADVVITDMIMPRESGITVVEKLRRDFPDVKVIAISGGGKVVKEDFLQLAKQIGAHRVLGKPFTQRELAEVVEDVLSN